MKPLLNQRFELPFKAVLVRCLDENKQPLNHASGFIRRESDKLFLYTCWHVVTGYDRNELKVSNRLPNRAFLSIELQASDKKQPGVEVIGGLQTLVLPLYNTALSPKEPLWFQDKRHVPHPDLNSIQLFVPFWHDAVKIALPTDLSVSDVQVVEENDAFPSSTLLTVGDKLYVVGFPYGFSAHGASQPTPVALPRYICATRIEGRQQEILMESTGAPGMSGGPVFAERDGVIYLLGIYTGLLFPDHVIKGNDKYTALGTCSNMSLHLWGHLPFVQCPDES